MQKTRKSDYVERSKDGTVIHANDTTAKMEVEINKIESEGDYKETPVYIYHDWCKKCGICASFCPTGTLASKPNGTPYVKHPEKCTHCELCDRLCPDFAITGAKKE